MSYLILMFVLKAINAPAWLVGVDIFCLVIKLIDVGIKLGTKNSK